MSKGAWFGRVWQRGRGAGQEGQKMGFPCRNIFPVPEHRAQGTGWVLAGISWTVSHLLILWGDLAAHPEWDRQGEEPAQASEGAEAAGQGPARVTGTAAVGSRVDIQESFCM